LEEKVDDLVRQQQTKTVKVEVEGK
jgi:hypothetical protein